MRLSASSIKDSQECNLKGYWKYVLKKEEREENHYGIFGRILHFIINVGGSAKTSEFNFLKF